MTGEKHARNEVVRSMKPWPDVNKPNTDVRSERALTTSIMWPAQTAPLTLPLGVSGNISTQEDKLFSRSGRVLPNWRACTPTRNTHSCMMLSLFGPWSKVSFTIRLQLLNMSSVLTKICMNDGPEVSGSQWEKWWMKRIEHENETDGSADSPHNLSTMSVLTSEQSENRQFKQTVLHDSHTGTVCAAVFNWS